MFVDRVQIEAQAGSGGNGCVSFRREKFVPRGGPDGGDGGDGGSVVILAQAGVDSLSALAHQKHWKAGKGRPGEGGNRHGRSSDDLVIRVPPGTVVVDEDGSFVLKDLTKADEQIVACRGGRGGKGNSRFKSSVNRAPREATPGGPGERRRLTLELKVIADVGLIGLPNAGKSTLLARLSQARPEIADYPFTTKYPNLGIVRIDMDRSLVMADIPGLIEGAHAGVGLGHEFLRHIQRAGILVHLVEPMPSDGSDPVENYHAIMDELGQYDESLLARPQIVVTSKCELPGSAEVRDRLAMENGGLVLAISAVTGEGLNALVGRLVGMLDEQRE